jgi:BirA family biotin operon repressor/biotin-[acetyl-CoA-carboxylase] ligase
LLLKPEAENPAEICYVAALAVEAVLRKLLVDKKVQLKWINDVLVNHKKISGILLEKTAAGFILVGIGLNIRNNQEHDAINATSLEALGCDASSDSIREQILEKFCYFYNLWVDYGFAPIRAQWLIAAYGLNKQVEVRTKKDSKFGIFIGMDADGNMLLLENDKVVSVIAGEVFFD